MVGLPLLRHEDRALAGDLLGDPSCLDVGQGNLGRADLDRARGDLLYQ